MSISQTMEVYDVTKDDLNAIKTENTCTTVQDWNWPDDHLLADFEENTQNPDERFWPGCNVRRYETTAQ